MKIAILWIIALTLALTACGAEASAEPAPPAIHFGEDVCELCGMIISEDRFAAAYITADGHGHTFDDIGDMVRAHLKMQEEVSAFFVHDYESRDWIRAETAHYVMRDNLPTPMLSGLAAFGSADKATDFADEGKGQVLSFDQVLAHYRQMPPDSAAPMSGGH